MTAITTSLSLDLQGQLVASLAASRCTCDITTIRECPDCGAALKSVPQDGRFNADQWDSIKAGDYSCSGDCTSSAARSGKKYWFDRELPKKTLRECSRCRVLAEVEEEQRLAAEMDADDARTEAEVSR